MTDVRVTQVAAEAVTLTTPPVRVTQVAIEVVVVEGCALQQDDGLLKIDSSGGPTTVTLDQATGRIGQVFYIKRIDDTANIVTIDPVDTTIDRQANLQVMPRDAIAIVYNGQEWWTV